MYFATYNCSGFTDNKIDYYCFNCVFSISGAQDVSNFLDVLMDDVHLIITINIKKTVHCIRCTHDIKTNCTFIIDVW